MWYDYGDGWDDDPESGERRFSNRELLARLFPYFRGHRKSLLAVLVLLVVGTAGMLAGPQVLRLVINLAVDNPGDTSLAWTIVGLGLLFVAVTAVGIAMQYFAVVVMARAGEFIVTRLKVRLFRHTLRLPVGFFTDYTPGRLLSRVESDNQSLVQLFSNVTVHLLGSILLFVGILVLMFLEDWQITLIVLGFAPLLTLLTFGFLRIIRPFYMDMRRRNAILSGFLAEYVRAVPVIQHYGYQQRARERLDKLQHDKFRANISGEFINYGFWGMFAYLEIAATVAIMVIGANKVADGTMDIGTVVLFIEYLRQVFMPILGFSEFLNFIQQALVAASRVFGILDIRPEDDHLEGKPAAEITPPTFAQAITFEDVRFSYAKGEEVLGGIDLTLRKGERVALVGASGGGKSTIANLLLHFYDPTSGAVKVDGVDLREFPRRAWLDGIGLVLQDVHLFPGTLRENLTVFDPDRSEAEVRRALDIVQALDLLERFPGGLDGEVVERGANLSLGERQLISFARALVHDPPLLVLDEATSSVDPVTEQRIQTSLDRMLAGRSALIIAHRLSTIVNADRILVVVGGQIVERGTHAELFALGGEYRRLFDLQFAAGKTAGGGA